jgi:DNA polymerase-1
MLIMHIPLTDASTADLLKAITKAGVRFRVLGRQLRVTGRMPTAMHPVLAELKARRVELMQLFSGDAGQASLDLLASLGVTPVVPATVEEALAVLEELLGDSRAITPPQIQERQGLWLGCDLETCALAGEEERPPIHLRLKDGLPALNQPVFRGRAALDPNRSRVRLAQLYGGGKRCLVLDTNLVPLMALAPVLTGNTPIIHNLAFEWRFLAAAGIELVHCEDTLQGCSLTLGAYRRGLDDAALTYLGIELPKDLQTSDWGAPVLSAAQIAYACLDAVVAFQLWRTLRVELHSKGRGAAYVLQRDATPPTARMIARGITLNLAAHQRQIERWHTEAAAARQAFRADQGQDPPNTPTELRAFLSKVLPPDVIAGWPRTPKSGELSTEGAELKRHSGFPAIRALLTLRAMDKLHSTFGENLAGQVSAVTGRLHPSFIVAGAKTGRFTCREPNLQQIPKHTAPGLRSAFVAGNGMVFVICDYNSMELRAAAEISDDSSMRADFANGVDLHRRQAAETQGVPAEEVTKEQRDGAKPINFGILYGAGARGLVTIAWNSYGIVKTEEQAAAERQTFLRRYPDLAAWQDRIYRQSNEEGFISIGQLGRVIEAAWETPKLPDSSHNHYPDHDTDNLFEGIDDADDDEAAPPLRQSWQPRLKRSLCINAPTQGRCADCSMRAMIKIDADLTAVGIDGGLVLAIHDEFVAEVPEADAGRALEIMEAAMTAAFAETFPDAPLTGLVESRISPTWGPSEEPNDTAGHPATAADGAESPPNANIFRDLPLSHAGFAGNPSVNNGSSPTPIIQRASWEERFASYSRVIGRSPHLHRNEEDGWIEGYWLFNDYARHVDYHGAYMRHLLKRYAALFFDCERVLHVCSGALRPDNRWLPGDTLDRNPALHPTFCTDAETCAGVNLSVYDTVFVDGPYTEADAHIYGFPMLNRQRVLGTLIHGLPVGALIVWLDEKPPPYRKAWPIAFDAVWGVMTSAGHRTRNVFVYRRT